MHITTTISSPNSESIIRSVASILHSYLIEYINSKKTINKNCLLYHFSEDKYILEKPEEFSPERIDILRKMPEAEDIYDFIKTL